ncbi:unnamed protein product [Colias eurytheme]|nr:unnamed protein product [Colias eurytheme]
MSHTNSSYHAQSERTLVAQVYSESSLLGTTALGGCMSPTAVRASLPGFTPYPGSRYFVTFQLWLTETLARTRVLIR